MTTQSPLSFIGKISIVFALVASLPVVGRAAPVTWNGGTGSWSSATWSGGVEPTAGDDVTFNGPLQGSTFGTVTMGSGEVAQSMLVNGAASGSYVFSGSAASLAVGGNLSLLFGGGREFTATAVTVGGLIISNSGNQGNGSSYVARNGGASLTIGSGGLNMTGFIDAAGQRTATVGFRGSASPFIILSGDVTMSGFGKFSNASVFTNNVQLDGNRTFTVQSNGGATLTNNSTQNNSNGIFTVSGYQSGAAQSMGIVRLTDNGATVGSVIKAGLGTLEIGTVSTYTGSTTVNAGTLALLTMTDGTNTSNGAIGSGPLNIGSAGTFKISGLSASSYTLSQTLNGDGDVDATGKTLIANGAVNPGDFDVTGGLTLGGLTNIEITSFSLFDTIQVSDLFTMGGTLNLLTGYTPTMGQTIDLFDWGTQAGTFSSIIGATGVWDTTNLYTNGTIVALGAVPEPGTYALMLMGLGTLVLVRRRTAASA